MPDVELESPEIDLDPESSTFRRRVALTVVLITLLGAIVGYLQQRSSNLEDNAARDAQIAAITGLGSQVQSSADFRSNFSIFVDSQLLNRRFIEASNRQRTVPIGSSEADRFGLDAARHAAVRDAVAPLTELSDDEYLSGSVTDPSLLEAELDVAPDEARLEQGVLADRADDFGGKADSYVAVLAVLAVSLFLLGLSLTVTSRARYFLAGPGFVVAVICIGWTAMISIRPTTQVSQKAIRVTAEATRLATQGDLDGAIDRYTEAVDDSPDFGAAYARRSDAHFSAGATQTSSGFISFVTDESRDASIADAEQALELGARDVNLLANLGFTLFLDSQFDRAADLTEQAIEGNDQLASVWFNLGVIELARSNDAEADRAYDRGIEVLEAEPDEFVLSQIFSAARNDLILVRELVDGRGGAARRIEGELAAAEAGLSPPDDDPSFADDVADNEVDDEIEDLAVERNGNPVFLDAVFPRGAIDEDTPLELMWYYRATDDQPFEQLPGMKNFIRAGAGSDVVASATFDSCLPAGEYRVQVYAGVNHLGSAETAVEASSLGLVSNVFEELDGVSLCVPQTWERSRISETLEGVDDQDGPLFSAPDASALVGLTSFSTSVEARANPQQSMDDAITAALGTGAVSIADESIEATDGSTFFDVPARVGILAGPDGVSLVLASLGPEPDGVMRVALVIADSQELVDQIRAEMLDTLFFTQVRTS